MFGSTLDVWEMNLGHEENRCVHVLFHGGSLAFEPWLRGEVEDSGNWVWVVFRLLACSRDSGTRADGAMCCLQPIIDHRHSTRKEKLL